MNKAKHPASRTGSHDNDDDDDLELMPPFRIFSAEHTIREHNVYLSRHIGAPSEYDDLCQMLRDAAPHDLFRMYLNTVGGDLSTGLALLQAMDESQAQIVTILNPQAYSMGALIFLAGDQLVAPPNSMLMLHDYSGGSSPTSKGNEQAGMVLAANSWFSEIMERICLPFLTKKELQSILSGQDLWLHGEPLQKRLRDLERTRHQVKPVQPRKPRRKATAPAEPSVARAPTAPTA